MNIGKLFENVEKPIIGVVHLKPLPGSPLYKGDFEEVYEAALRDADALYSGDVDGIIIENYGDKPYVIYVKNPLTLTAMSIIAYEVRRKYNDIYLGINVLRNSGVEALAIAYNVKANFIRVNNLCQMLVSPEGLLYPIAEKIIRLREYLKASIKILADINVKHASPLDARSIEYVAKDCVERCLADALIITGSRTGEEASINDLVKVKKAVSEPVLVGSGITLHNISKYWKFADGFIVGTYFKLHEKTENPVDYSKVVKLMKYVKSLREVSN